VPSPRRAVLIGATKGEAPGVDYNAPIIGGLDQERMRIEFWIAKQIGQALMRKYPNRQWLVDVDCRNEVIVIGCPSVSKRKGYRLHMRRDPVATLIRRAGYAAGEILERYGVSRSKLIDPSTLENFDRDVYDDAIANDSQTDIASKL
jgi:hypothetical protein